MDAMQAQMLTLYAEKAKVIGKKYNVKITPNWETSQLNFEYGENVTDVMENDMIVELVILAEKIKGVASGIVMPVL